MALPNLNGLFISDSYSGLLHTSNQPINSSTFNAVYDGQGNLSKLSLSQNAVKINDIQYPTSDGTDRTFLKTNGQGVTSFSSIESGDLPNLSPDPRGDYTNINKISVDSKGRVTAITSLIDDDGDGGTYDGHIAVSRTYFRNSKQYVGDDNPNSPTDGINSSTKVPNDDWKFININEFVSNSAKTAIVYIETFTDEDYRATISAARSDSGTGAYPVLTIYGESSGFIGGGSQFTTRLGTNDGNKGFWLKITDSDGTLSVVPNALFVRLYLLGFQE